MKIFKNVLTSVHEGSYIHIVLGKGKNYPRYALCGAEVNKGDGKWREPTEQDFKTRIKCKKCELKKNTIHNPVWRLKKHLGID